jgi:Flp pilus assembly pilin Flp
MTKAYIAINTWSNTIVRKMRERGDRGASVVEYAGLVVIIALIVVAVKALNLDQTISQAIGTAVTTITGGK